MNRKRRLRSSNQHVWRFRDAGMWACKRCNRLQRGEDGGHSPPPIQYCTGMKRTRLKSVSPRKQEKRDKRIIGKELAKYAVTYSCPAFGKDGHICELPIDPHHVKTVGSGYGDWLPPDDLSDGDPVGNVASPCRGLHREIDSPNSGPKTVERKYGIDLAAEARAIGEDFIRQHGIPDDVYDHYLADL